MDLPDNDGPLPPTATPAANFACRRCGACCRWEGEVRISPSEAEALAVRLGLDTAAFIADMTQLTRDRRALTLRERPDGACILYQDDPPGCLAYEARPQQCRDFPHGWRFPGWEALCGGDPRQNGGR